MYITIKTAVEKYAVRPLIFQKKKTCTTSTSSLFMVPVTGVDGLCPSFAARTPDYVRLRRGGSTPHFQKAKREPVQQVQVLFFGAGDRGRTGTVSLPLDFESSTSANSITPANITELLYYILLKKSILNFYLVKIFK